MKFTVDPKIFEKFPGVEIGVIVATGINNKGNNNEILALLRQEEGQVQEKLTGVEFGSLPEIYAWRKIYKDFGSDSSFRASIEALLKRARGGKSLPQINNLVDLYNFLSLKYYLPIGAEDLDKVEGDIKLTYADGSEKGIYLGSGQEESCYNGEVIYRDDKGFICRRWNWREAERTKIDSDTENIVLVIEKAPGLEKINFQKSLDNTMELIKKYLGGKLQKYILTYTNQYFEIEFQTGKKKTNKKETKKIELKHPVQKVSIIDQKHNNNYFSVTKILSLIIFEAIREKFSDFNSLSLEDINIEHPKIENYGDYSTNLALKLSKILKMKPRDIAIKIIEQINNYIIMHKSIILSADSKESNKKKIIVSDILEKLNTDTIGSGFINFKLTNSFFIKQTLQLLKNKNTVPITYRKKIAIEHTQPNTNKPQHIGHIRNSILGMAIINIYKYAGFDTLSTNINNDRGAHICKSMWGYLTCGQKDQKSKIKDQNLNVDINNISWRDLLKRWIEKPEEWVTPEESKRKPDYFVGDYYVIASKLEKDNPKVDRDVFEMLQAWENDDKDVHLLWETMNGWFYEGRNETLKRLGVYLDEEKYESKIYKKGKQIVLEGAKKGIFVKLPDGAIEAKLEKYGLPDKILIRRDGTSIYMTFDIELTRERFRDKKLDYAVWVVGSDQILHFQQLFTICNMLGYMKPDQAFHLAYGMVYLSGGKQMSSREGNVTYADDVIDKIVSMAEKKAVEAKLQINDYDRHATCQAVGIGALKYSLLKVNPMMDINFDMEKSVSFTGDSGPYLQYTYARCKSVLRKAEEELKIKNPACLAGWQVEEMSVLRYLYRLPEVVHEAGRTFSPNLICEYLYNLAQKYNLFYNKHSILTPEEKNAGEIRDFRLFLTAATAEILKRGLMLLGIETVEKM